MLFNSPLFLFGFLPLVLAGFVLLGRFGGIRAAIAWLAVVSLIFYAWDDPSRLPILLGSIGFNFIIGRLLSSRRNSPLLALGIAANLTLLGYFKYAGFFAATINALAGTAIPDPHIDLPVGISFFTFTQIAFLVDAFRREAHEYKPLHYVLFVSFFPHLVAGPIYHHREIIPQFGEASV